MSGENDNPSVTIVPSITGTDGARHPKYVRLNMQVELSPDLSKIIE